MRIAEKFESFLGTYRRPDGQRWTGQDLYEATGGVVTRSYVSTLRKGKISSPGFDKLRAIARAMGFPPELWFEDVPGSAPRVERVGRSFAERLEHLFDVVRDDRTGEPYENADVARRSLGDLTEEEVEEMRTGVVSSPSMDQVLSISEVFGVDPSYFLDKGEKPPLLDAEALSALADQRSRLILNKSSGLSDGEKDLIIDMIERLGGLHDADSRAG